MVRGAVLILLGVDPGQKTSGIVTLYDKGKDVPDIVDARIGANNSVLEQIQDGHGTKASTVVIELPVSHGTGQPASQAFVDTCIWTGQFIQAAHLYATLPRHTVTSHLGCRGDSQVRAYVIQRYMQAHHLQSVKETLHGPLAGVTSHSWSALAVALTWIDKQKLEKRASA